MKSFDPQKWLHCQSSVPASPKPPHPINSRMRKQSNVLRDIDIVVSRITTDIAPNYNDWLALGFALASELGESGRTYYHHLSSFYVNYKIDETDRQYTNCLRSRGQGVTIKTFFQLAKNAGININTRKENDER